MALFIWNLGKGIFQKKKINLKKEQTYRLIFIEQVWKKNWFLSQRSTVHHSLSSQKNDMGYIFSREKTFKNIF